MTTRTLGFGRAAPAPPPEAAIVVVLTVFLPDSARAGLSILGAQSRSGDVPTGHYSTLSLSWPVTR
jgi:hypothetical protein